MHKFNTKSKLVTPEGAVLSYWDTLEDDYSTIWNRKKVIEPLPNTNWYFAFGSNMSRKRMQKRGLIWEHVLKAKLIDYELAFDKKAYSIGEGFANIKQKKGSIVEGVLYKLEDKKQAHILDDFEATPEHYERHEVLVKCKQFAKPIKAFTYIANPKKVEKGLCPSADYLNHLLDGERYLSTKYHYWISQTKTIEDYPELFEDLQIFVYGTLKTGFGNHNRFCKNAYMIQDAVLDGTLYDTGLPYVTVPRTNQFCTGSMDYKKDELELSNFRKLLEETSFTDIPECGVKGQLVTFDDWSELYSLDALEGFNGAGSEYNHYERILTTCFVDGIEEPCFVYVTNETKHFIDTDIVQDGNYRKFEPDFLEPVEDNDYRELYENADNFKL